MVLGDLFNLSDSEYALRIKSYTDDKLWTQLKVKNMQIQVGEVVSKASVPATMEDILISGTYIPVILGSISSIGKRRVVVSKAKIRLIEAELQSRDHSTGAIESAVDGPPIYEDVVVYGGTKDANLVVADTSTKTSALYGNLVDKLPAYKRVPDVTASVNIVVTATSARSTRKWLRLLCCTLVIAILVVAWLLAAPRPQDVTQDQDMSLFVPEIELAHAAQTDA